MLKRKSLLVLLPLLFVAHCLRTRVYRNKTHIRSRSESKKAYTQKENPCNLDASVFVKKVLDDNFYPVYEKYKLNIPQQCPFKWNRNMHRSVVENTHYTMSDWPKCGFCGKAFYDKSFFHQHMNRKHNDTFNTQKDSICLADYCDVFRCEVHRIGSLTKLVESAECNSKDMKKIQMKCEKVMQSCLPLKMSDYVYDSVMKSICSSITCDKYHIPAAEISALEILLYVILTVLGAFLSLVGCCFVIENFQYERVEKNTQRRQQHTMPRPQVTVMRRLETTTPRNRRLNTTPDHVFITVDPNLVRLENSTIINFPD